MSVVHETQLITPSRVADIVPMWADATPTAVALIEAGRSWSFAELGEAIRKTAQWLEDAGVRPGDRVMLVCENSCAAVAIYFACTGMGAWPVIVNARLSDREIDEIREHSGARCVALTTAASARAKAHAVRMEAAAADPAGFGAVAITAINETTHPEPVPANEGQNIAALIYTSGTTGKPKGVMLSHENLLFVAAATARARRLTPNDRVLAILPVSHILGLTGVLLGTLLAGGTVYLTSRFDPAHLLGALKKDGLSVMLGAPSLYALLAEYAERKKQVPIDAPALRLISSAGAPLDAATKSTAESCFAQTLHNGYGITECGPSISLTALDAPRSDCAVGRILPGIRTRVVDPEGKDVAAGQAGELWVHSPGVMKGYYRAPEETAQAVSGGWFKTGDLARVEDGNLFIVGRCKEMIIRFGFNVYPAEIEAVLNAHPDVARSAVIGRNSDSSEEVLAFVQPVSGSNLAEQDLADFAAAQLAPYKRPSRIVIVPALPMSPAGKILKSELGALA